MRTVRVDKFADVFVFVVVQEKISNVRGTVRSHGDTYTLSKNFSFEQYVAVIDEEVDTFNELLYRERK